MTNLKGSVFVCFSSNSQVKKLRNIPHHKNDLWPFSLRVPERGSCGSSYAAQQVLPFVFLYHSRSGHTKTLSLCCTTSSVHRFPLSFVLGTIFFVSLICSALSHTLTLQIPQLYLLVSHFSLPLTLSLHNEQQLLKTELFFLLPLKNQCGPI